MERLVVAAAKPWWQSLYRVGRGLATEQGARRRICMDDGAAAAFFLGDWFTSTTWSASFSRAIRRLCEKGNIECERGRRQRLRFRLVMNDEQRLAALPADLAALIRDHRLTIDEVLVLARARAGGQR
jgi:hypothetical protein